MSQASPNPPWRQQPTTPPYLLPPLHMRTGKEEERTRTIVGKDLEAFCRMPTPGPDTPWLFTEYDTIGEAGELLAPQTALPQTTIQLSQAGQGDGTYLENPPDIDKLAKEAEDSFANELIKNGKLSSQAEDKRYTRDRTLWERTDYTDTRPYTRRKDRVKNGEKFSGKWEDLAPEASTKHEFFEPITPGVSDEERDWFDYNAKGEGEASLNPAKQEGKLGIDLNAGGSIWDKTFDLGYGKVDVKAGSAELKGKAEGSVKLKGTPEATVNIDVGGELNLIEAKYETEEHVVYPLRAWNYTVPYINKTLDWVGVDRRVVYAPRSWDWGIYFKGEASGQVGAGVKGEAKAGKMDKGRWGLRLKGKASLLLGAGAGGDVGVKAPD